MLQSVIQQDGKKNIINVTRYDVLDGGFRAFDKPNFNSKHLLSVRFADEMGIDTGGLSREFMTLAMRQIIKLPIFAGDDKARTLVLNVSGRQLVYLSILVIQTNRRYRGTDITNLFILC